MCALLSTMVNIDRVSSIEVAPFRNAVRITVPDCASVIVRWESQRIRVLTQSVQVGFLRQFRAQPDILRLEHEIRGGRVEQNLPSVSTRHFERERVLGVVEFQSWATRTIGDLGTREHRLGNLIHLLITVIDLNMEASICDVSS